MNNRIQELAKQVYVTGDPWKNKDEPQHMWYNFREDALEEFAKLIIQECMSCSTWVGAVNTFPNDPAATAKTINKRIKAQFGIEE